MASLVGKRCSYNGNRGTIRFEGEISLSEGEWLGVEWDEPRGKHNGTIKDVSYFVCKDLHGSFVRPDKLNLGVTVLEALFKRYAMDYTVPEDDMYVCGDAEQVTKVQSVGFDKLETGESALTKLTFAEISEMDVSSPGDMNASLSKSITTMHLSRNLFSSWRDIIMIAKELPLLQSLDISDNLLTDNQEAPVSSRTIPSVQKLYLNRMQITPETLACVLKIFCGVQQLHCCFNGLTSLCTELSNFQHIQVLNFEGNELSKWEDIQIFSKLPCLESLILNRNSIASIEIPSSDNFPCLTSLSLNNNAIVDWASINQLNNIPLLKEVRFRENPLTRSMPSLDARLELIARLRNVNRVNGSPVVAKERQTAEITYMKRYSLEWFRKANTKLPDDPSVVDFNIKYPAYLDYVQVYGPPAHDMPTAGTSLSKKLVLLNFQCKDKSVDVKTALKRVPVTITVQQLKGLVRRLFKINLVEQKLARFEDSTQRDIPLDDNSRQLSYYSFATNDVVVVRKLRISSS